jgi:hypothetical protein
MLAEDWIGRSKLKAGRQGLLVGHGCSLKGRFIFAG